MVGTVISHYRIVSELGKGGMGVVYRAEDTKLDRTVALKLLAPHMLASEADRARFYREARAAAALHHPNIATVFEIDETEDGRPFIAMEFIEGAQLDEGLSDKPLPVERAVAIASQIARALKAAHERGIVHRDIKSANVMLTKDGTAKVLDFGLAKTDASTKLTQMGSTVGTIAYMSPEQARGEEVDHRTDLWSLGAVLYEMLTGQLPFPGAYEQAVVYGILNGEPVPVTGLRSGVPLTLEQVAQKCLRKDASHRYQSAAGLLADLESLNVSTTVTQSRTVDPQRRGIPAWASVVAVMAVAAAVWYLKPSPEEDRIVRKFTMQVAGIDGLEDMDMSPDGRYMSFWGFEPDGTQAVFVYEFETGLSHRIEGSVGGAQPDFSPDSRTIAFSLVGGNGLYIAQAPDGEAQDLEVLGSQVTWLSDSELMFARGDSIWTMDVSRRDPQLAFSPDTARGHQRLGWPRPIRDNLVSFVAFGSGAGDSGTWTLSVGDLSTGAYDLLEQDACCARWMDSGHLLYVSDVFFDPERGVGRVSLRPFSPRSRAFTGPPVQVFARGLTYSHDIGAEGTLVYAPEFADWTRLVEAAWIDPTGIVEPSSMTFWRTTGFDWSPDGRFVAHTRRTASGPQVTLTDGETGNSQSLGVAGQNPAWAPDGRSIYFLHGATGRLGNVSTVGSQPPRWLLSDVSHFSIDPGGKSIAVVKSDTTRGVWLYDVVSDITTRLDSTSLAAWPQFSPDGRYVAYEDRRPTSPRLVVSAVDGRPNRDYPELTGNLRRPMWSPDGRWLYFNAGPITTSELHRLPVSLDTGFSVIGQPEAIVSGQGTFRMAFHPDGRLMTIGGIRERPDEASNIEVAQNWDLEAIRLAPGN